jgi:hypothetical protein
VRGLVLAWSQALPQSRRAQHRAKISRGPGGILRRARSGSRALARAGAPSEGSGIDFPLADWSQARPAALFKNSGGAHKDHRRPACRARPLACGHACQEGGRTGRQVRAKGYRAEGMGGAEAARGARPPACAASGHRTSSCASSAALAARPPDLPREARAHLHRGAEPVPPPARAGRC